MCLYPLKSIKWWAILSNMYNEYNKYTYYKDINQLNYVIYRNNGWTGNIHVKLDKLDAERLSHVLYMWNLDFKNKTLK